MATATKSYKASEILGDLELDRELAEGTFEQAKQRLAENLMSGWRAIASHTEWLTEAQTKYVIRERVRKILAAEKGPATTRERLEIALEMGRGEMRSIIRGSLMTRSTCPITNFFEGIEREAKLHTWDEIIRLFERRLAAEIVEDVTYATADGLPD